MSHLSLSRYGYILKKDELTKDQISTVKKDLTVKPLVLPIFQTLGLNDNTSPYPIYIESAQRLFLPRFYGVEKFGPPTLNTISPGMPIDIVDNIKLMKHQVKAYDILLNQLNTYGGGVLTLPCGFGKTVIGLKAIAAQKQKALVVVNKEFLMDQWIDRIEQFLPNSKIGIVQQDKEEIAGNDIIIGMLHSLSKKEYAKGTFDEIGFVIFDECHHLAAEMFSKALPKVASQYMLGLSATPTRKDGLSYVFYHYLGPLFHQEKRTGSNIVTVKQIKLTSRSAHYDNKYNNIRGKQMKNTKGMVGELCLFKERNELAMKVIEVLIRQGRTILILSERREHLENLMKMMDAASFRTPQNRFATYGLYYGKAPGMNKKMHKKMLEETSRCDVIFGTNSMASEALDIPNLNTLVMLSPMTDVEQASGRILRKYHEKVNPIIVDLIDKCGNFPKHGKMREDYFRSENYIIESYAIQLYEDKLNKYDGLVTYLDPVQSLIGKTSSSEKQGKNVTDKKSTIITAKKDIVIDSDIKLVPKEPNLLTELKIGHCLLDDGINSSHTGTIVDVPVKKQRILTPKKPL